MSMYNMLFGVNPFSRVLLAMLGAHVHTVPRYRDCFLNADGDIVIYTRTGGGNRADYVEGNNWLRTLPGYIGDGDDQYDSTYAMFRYRPPEKFAAEIKLITLQGGKSEDPAVRFKQLMDKMSDPSRKNDPEVQHALEVGREVLGPLIDQLEARQRKGGE
jgi:hypothetical protein